MIKELKMYTVICDNCGKDVNTDAEYSCWSDESTAELIAMDDGEWINVEDKHYCHDCFSYDDEDNLLIKNNHQPSTNNHQL